MSENLANQKQENRITCL